MIKYRTQTLKSIASEFIKAPSETVSLNGKSLTIAEIQDIASGSSNLEITNDSSTRESVENTYKLMMSEVKKGTAIYGVNTAYGGQASLIKNEGSIKQRVALARKISNSMAHVDVSTGPAIPKNVTRAAIAIRANMLLKGVSAVSLESIELLMMLINKDLIPVVGSYGGLGASGDLPQNGRVLSVLRQLKGTKVWGRDGEPVDAIKRLQNAGIPPLVLSPKAGLGLVNGDNFSTAFAHHIAHETLFALLTQSATGALMYEALLATNRSLHPLLYEVRPHDGQKEVSRTLRSLLEGSKIVRDELHDLLPPVPGRKVQDVYSIRCMSQFLGVSWEKIKWAFDVIEVNANSASDNPLWVTDEYLIEGEDPGHWVSGGNFLAMHMVEVIDGLRKTMTHLVKLNDRHIARLIDPHENNGLPPNLSDKAAISQCTFKGVQAQAGMYDVYSTFLSMPVSTLFGIHEQNNQDVTSHAITSAIIGEENLRIVYLSLSQVMIAIAQAIDLRGAKKHLSPKTYILYKYVRKRVPYIKEETPLGPMIEFLAEEIKSQEFRHMLITEILS